MNSSNNNTHSGSTKYQNWPRFPAPLPAPPQRVISHSFDPSMSYDHSIPNRTVSSTSTMMSTPSNRRRRPQKNPPSRKPDLPHPMSKKGRLIKSKLLNLTQSSKERAISVSRDSSFVIQRPNTLPGYDHSVFSQGPVRQSQVLAWQSAERVASSIIFGPDSEDESDDANTLIDPVRSSTSVIRMVPGFTKGELDVALKATTDEEAQRSVYEYKKLSHRHHEQQFLASSSVTHKRQVQLAQKKEVYSRLFGDANRLNNDYITNNSYCSAIDNSADVHESFHEDKIEVTGMVAEEKAFNSAMGETARLFSSQNSPVRKPMPPVASPTKQRRRATPPIADDDVDYEKLQTMIGQRLDGLYAGVTGDGSDADLSDISIDTLSEELQGYVCRHLRARLKE